MNYKNLASEEDEYTKKIKSLEFIQRVVNIVVFLFSFWPFWFY